MEGDTSGIYTFGPFQLDTGEGRVTKEGIALKLDPRLFDILLEFLKNPKQLLTFEHFLETLWIGTYVGKDNISRNVSTLRAALDDADRHNRKYIETIPRKGYRFIGDVQFAPKTDGPNVQRSIAVLPFKPYSASDQSETLGFGMAETIITKLSEIRQAVVRPTPSVLKYNNSGQDPLEIGRQFGVDLILDGRIQHSDGRIRITTQLLRIKDGVLLWSEQFDEPYKDIFNLQDSISEKVASQLEVRITGRDKTRMTRRYTDNTNAYHLYQRGLFYWNKRTVEGLLKSIDFFNQASAEDEEYALAYAGIAASQVMLGSFGSEYVNPKQAMPEAKAAAARAIEIDPMLAEAYASYALVTAAYDWDWAQAELMFRRAIELKPNYATAHHWYANCLGAAGQLDEALREIELAQHLDPHSLIIAGTVGWIHYFRRQFDTAIELCSQATDMNPYFFVAHIYLGLSLLQKKEFARAIEAFHKANRLAADNPAVIAELGHAYALAGNKKEARKLLKALDALARKRYVTPHAAAKIHLGLGNTDKVFECLERAFDDRSSWLIHLKEDPVFDSIRTEPKFVHLVERVGYG